MSLANPPGSTSPLSTRARALVPDELAQIPWLQALDPAERERAEEGLVLTSAQAGDHICRIGRPVTYWFGLVDGLLKMNKIGRAHV